MKRLDTKGLLLLGDSLGEPERALLLIIGRLRLMSHAQVAALLTPGTPAGTASSSATAARVVRRQLQRFSDLGLLARLARRIGGLRAGSAGFVYYLGPAGQRLVAYWHGQGLVRGRYRPEPAGRYVRHRLAVTQCYVDLMSAAASGDLDLLAFDVEPDCWRTHVDVYGGQRLVKPDAFARIGVGAYEDRWFIEVDLGSESRTVIARKLRAYVDYFHSGQEQAEHGVFPRVLLLTNSQDRKAALVDLCARLPAESWQLFTIGLLGDFAGIVGGQLEDNAEHEAALGAPS